MSYNFTPKTDEELYTVDVVPRGVYGFEVLKSERMTSKAGNPMCKLNLRFWDAEGKPKFIFDYLVFSDINLNIRKVKHFCDSVGLTEEYKKGEIPEDLTGRCGEFELGIEDERPNPNGGMFPKKNTVADYIKKKQSEEVNTKSEDEFNDDVPF